MTVSTDKNAGIADIGSRTSKEPFRYRLYYRLMDLASAVILTAIVTFVLLRTTDTPPSSLPMVIAFGLPIIVFLINSLTVPILIVTSKLRDEYAEILWRRTVAQLTVLTIWIVPILTVLVWTTYLLTHDGGFGVKWGSNRPDWLDPIYLEEDRFSTVYAIWHFYTIGFVILFQFNRWRDSRAASE